MPAGSRQVGQVDQAVGADQEEEIVAGPLAVHGLQRLDAVVRAGAPGLDLGDLEGRVAGDRDPGHLEAMSDRRPVSPLVRRSAGDDEPDPVEPAGLAALLGQDQVAEMDRVERAAEKPQSHGVENSRPIPAIPHRSSGDRPLSCGQTCRNRVNWQRKMPARGKTASKQCAWRRRSSTIGPTHEPCQS